MISVLAAVRERTAMLETMLQSLHATAAGPVEVILRCDLDDDEMLAYLRRRKWASSVIVGPRLGGYVSCPVFLNEAARFSSGDLLLVVNDDVVFTTPGWDVSLQAKADPFVDGICLLGVETLNAGHFPFTCVPRSVVEALGFLLDERLIYTDIWMRDVMARFNRAIRVEDVVIEHRWQGMSADQTTAQRLTTSMEYQALYTRCVEEAVQKIRTWGVSLCA